MLETDEERPVAEAAPAELPATLIGLSGRKPRFIS